MADSLQSLLTLPITSDAFTKSRLFNDRTDHSSSRRHERDSVPRQGVLQLKIKGPHTYAPIPDPIALSAKLKRYITAILTKDASSSGLGTEVLPYESIYSMCCSVVCECSAGDGLYRTLKLEVEKCVSALMQELKRETSPHDEERNRMLGYVEEFVDICQWYATQVKLLQSLLTYLNQFYILRNPGMLSIHDLCFSQFAQILDNPSVHTRLVFDLNKWVKSERDLRVGVDNRTLIPSLIAHLMTHNHYQQIFEDPYLEELRAYYVRESQELAARHADDGAAFLKEASVRLEEEVERAKDLLPSGSWATVRRETQQSLFGQQLQWLAKTALSKSMDNKDFKGLAQIYKIFVQVQGAKILCNAFKAHVELCVRGIVGDPVLDDDMINRLLELKSFVDAVTEKAFADPDPTTSPSTKAESKHAPKCIITPTRPHKDFVYAASDAFTSGFAVRPLKPAELLARHLDRALRKGQRDVSDAEFARSLDHALSLYKFTKDKDVFRAFYQKGLAKRLLLDKSASDDFEKAVLKKLKDEFDSEFGVSNQMFTDLALSRDKMKEYYKKGESTSGLNVMVLQRSVWPFAIRNKTIDLPPSMQDELTRYAEFYKTKHQGHKLYWDHTLGTVTLKARFANGEKDLTMSLYQAVVLLLFNDANELSYRDIELQTHMMWEVRPGSGERVRDELELKRTLQSLACGKKKVLKKVPQGKDVNDTDAFKFNSDFTDPHAKVHINSIQVKDTPEESKRTQITVEGDRRHYVDAAIVRVMKRKKEMPLEELKTATIDAVKSHFVPDVKTIKQRIEVLVEGEYMMRDEDDPNTFIYIA